MKNDSSNTDLRVRDCLVWKTPERPGQKPGRKTPKQDVPRTPVQPNNNVRLYQKPDIGKARSRGFDIPETTHEPKAEDGTVIEALRGWPRDRKAYGAEDYNPYGNREAPCGGEFDSSAHDDVFAEPVREPVAGTYDECPDYRSARGQRSKQDKAGIKANKTSMLRQMKQQEKILAQNKPLWKMSKFTKNAKPHLSTLPEKKSTQNGRQADTGGSRRSILSETAGQPCTCSMNTADDGLFGPDYRDLAQDGGQTQDYDQAPAPGVKRYEYFDVAL